MSKLLAIVIAAALTVTSCSSSGDGASEGDRDPAETTISDDPQAAINDCVNEFDTVSIAAAAYSVNNGGADPDSTSQLLAENGGNLAKTPTYWQVGPDGSISRTNTDELSTADCD